MTNTLSIAAEANRDTESIVSYAYSYPHKSSYRKLEPAIAIADAWASEDQTNLALYAHIPFCEMRCGFYNLFTQSQPSDDRVRRYLTAIVRQTAVVRTDLPSARFSTFAIGGGTPTYLDSDSLNMLLSSIQSSLGFDIRNVPTSVETSPATATSERLKILASAGVERISLGVQSFLESETQAFGRPQQMPQVHAALELIRSFEFPVLNIDLIYGSPVQSRQSWLQSLRTALQFQPEELYLYPLYVRPQTGLARTGHRAADHRLDLYRTGRDLLLSEGYRQLSLRCFRRPGTGADSSYSCERDGMIGIGCGARSYTSRLHYATRFAVTQAGVRAIMDEWMEQSDEQFTLATHGIALTDDECRRRRVILSILQTSGLDQEQYLRDYGACAVDDVPELKELFRRDWLTEESGHLFLTEAGLENSDIAGPILYSISVRDRLQEFVRL